MHGGLLTADGEKRVGVHRRDAGGIEVAEPFAQHGRPGEGLLHRHLLIEREADQQRVRILGEQAISRLVTGPGEQRGSGHGDYFAAMRFSIAASMRASVASSSSISAAASSRA